ncbi:MAG TPA: methyl-accepting chemotaxis protein, partial [Xanthomonadaceae bacterium]|nr:methyl-accepting chemotaxis protein [Xanthomonadaceae bacterium]
MGKSHLAGRLTLLVAAFAGLFLIFCATTWYTVDQVRVQGKIYEQIVSGKDLIADILPPPEYIIEAYLVSRELNDETDPTRISELVERGDQLRVDYESRQEFWRRELPQNSLKDLMTVTAYRSAMQFFQLRDEQFVPAIRAGDHERAKAILAQMKQHYDAHRLAIDQVVQLATQQNAAYESQSKDVIAHQTTLLVVLAAGILLVVGFMAVYAQRSARDLSSRIRMASEIANRVASGDLATEVPGTDRDDEAGQLLQAINKMTLSLRGLVTRAKQASIELMSTATE